MSTNKFSCGYEYVPKTLPRHRSLAHHRVSPITDHFKLLFSSHTFILKYDSLNNTAIMLSTPNNDVLWQQTWIVSLITKLRICA